jgi:hypothetical protein
VFGASAILAATANGPGSCGVKGVCQVSTAGIATVIAAESIQVAGFKFQVAGFYQPETV